jgi:ABC-type branched-subunit amino acid transport system ATPase component
VNQAEVVTVQHLVKRYGPLIAVNDVSFSISEGEIFGLSVPTALAKRPVWSLSLGCAPDSLFPLGVAHWHAQGMS